ncbi:MAG TPA: polymer-forming cytoskeletal protein [Zeimonas sp.]
MLVAVASAFLALPVSAASSGADRFVAGATVTERAPVEGDLFAAAGSVDVDAAVAGDAVVAGGTVRLGADVGDSVYAAGGRLSLVGHVQNNARLAGGQVQVEPDARIGGNLTVTAGRIELRGATDGSVGAAGGHVLIDAPIGGDVEVAAGSIELGPKARIAGDFRYRSSEALQRDPGAQVSGTVERLGPEFAEESEERPMRWVGTVFAVLWTIGLTLLAAIVVALVPRASASISQALRERPGFALLLGFVVLVCTPIAVVLSFVTVIGIPLGLLALLVYLMLLPLAWIAAAIGIGDWFAAQLPSSGNAVAPRVVAAALAVVLLAFLARVPWVGGWIAFVAMMAGLGALALQFRRLLPG